MRLRPQQKAAGRRNGAHPRFAFAEGGEDIKLLFRCAAFRLIGAGKVADDIHRLTHVLALAQPLIKRFGILRAHAQAVHARVELHPHGDRLAQFGRFQRGQLFFVMHRRVQVLIGNGRQVRGFKKAFEEQNRLRNSTCAQAESFFETGDAKSVGIGERSRGLKKTVSVSVRFHDCNELTGGRQFSQTLQVVSQSAAVNNNSCRLHLNSLEITHHHIEDRHSCRNATTGR